MICVKCSKRAKVIINRTQIKHFHHNLLLSNAGNKDDLKSLFDRYKVNAKSSESVSGSNNNNTNNTEEDGEDKLKSLFAKFSLNNPITYTNNNKNNKKSNSSYNNSTNNLNEILGGKMSYNKPKAEKKKPKFNPKRDIDYKKIPEELHTAVKWINKEATRQVLLHEPSKQFFNFTNITQLINDTDWNVNGILIKKKGLSYKELKDFITDDLVYIPIKESENASVVSIVPIKKLDLDYYKQLEKKSIVMRLGGGSFLDKIEEKEANILESSNSSVSNDKIFKPMPINWDCQISDLHRKFDTALRIMKKNYKLELQLGPAGYLKSAMFNKTHLNKVHDVTRSSMKNNTDMHSKDRKEFNEEVETFFTTRKYNANKSLTTRNEIFVEVETFLESLNAKYKFFGTVETFIVISVHEYSLKAREEWLKEKELEKLENSEANLMNQNISVSTDSSSNNKKDKKNKKGKKHLNTKTKDDFNKSEVTDFYNMKIED
ncbi:hypothetical protein ACO0SA_001267 [Hanseniaspora valbyensis]